MMADVGNSRSQYRWPTQCSYKFVISSVLWTLNYSLFFVYGLLAFYTRTVNYVYFIGWSIFLWYIYIRNYILLKISFYESYLYSWCWYWHCNVGLFYYIFIFSYIYIINDNLYLIVYMSTLLNSFMYSH